MVAKTKKTYRVHLRDKSGDTAFFTIEVTAIKQWRKKIEVFVESKGLIPIEVSSESSCW